MPSIRMAQDDTGNTTLHWYMASCDPDTDFIELLLDRGVDPNVINYRGLTPLAVAFLPSTAHLSNRKE